MTNKIIRIIVSIIISFFIANALSIGELGWLISYIALILTFIYLDFPHK